MSSLWLTWLEERIGAPRRAAAADAAAYGVRTQVLEKPFG